MPAAVFHRIESIPTFFLILAFAQAEYEATGAAVSFEAR